MFNARDNFWRNDSFKNGSTSLKDYVSSDCSQRRSSSIAGIMDEKSSHNDQTDDVTYYVAPKVPSDAGSDTKKRSHSFIQPVIRFDVPNTQLTTIAKRPPQFGHAGQRIEIYTNHFKINFCTSPNKIILYQFDVDVEILMFDRSWYSCEKDERLQVMKKIISEANLPLVWWDEGKNLYSFENLLLNI